MTKEAAGVLKEWSVEKHYIDLLQPQLFYFHITYCISTCIFNAVSLNVYNISSVVEWFYYL